MSGLPAAYIPLSLNCPAVSGIATEKCTYAAWNSPELISKISQVDGINLVPSIDFEIASINISANNSNVPVVQSKDEPLGDGLCSVSWHYDSFPFVCVVMLSDCTEMLGRETALRTPSDEL